MACSHEHDHNHKHDELDRGQEYSLYQHIDTPKVRCFNEKVPGSAVGCFKPWNNRLETTTYLESDDDEELIIYIPFTGAVKLKSIMIIGGDNGSSPKKLSLFTNRDDIDFSSVGQMKPVQEIELHEDFKGEIEYPLKIAKFNNVSSLVMYLSANYGAASTKVYYIGLKGDWTHVHRGPVLTTYEAKPLAKDHKQKEEFGMSKQIQ